MWKIWELDPKLWQLLLLEQGKKKSLSRGFCMFTLLPPALQVALFSLLLFCANCLPEGSIHNFFSPLSPLVFHQDFFLNITGINMGRDVKKNKVSFMSPN